MSLQPTEDEDVVRSDGGDGSGGGSLIVGDWNVALAIEGLDGGTRVVGVGPVGDGRRVALSLVVEDDKPVGVVEVAEGKDVVGIHDHGWSCCSAVALLIKDEHGSEEDSILLSLVNVKTILELDGSEDDLPSNPCTGPIALRDAAEGVPAESSKAGGNGVLGEVCIQELGFNSRGLEPAIDS